MVIILETNRNIFATVSVCLIVLCLYCGLVQVSLYLVVLVLLSMTTAYVAKNIVKILGPSGRNKSIVMFDSILYEFKRKAKEDHTDYKKI
jgi:hypothetical protein